MNKQLVHAGLLWGFLLWLIGYVLGIILFVAVPPALLGWVIMPIGIAITLWVLYKKITLKAFNDYVLLGIVWTIIAIVLDYFLLVKVFKPADGYYKLDVYIYYITTFVLPVFVGWQKKRMKKH